MKNERKVEEQSNNRKELIKALTLDLPVLRARLSLSQGDIAERIGVSRQTYSGIETGKREMTWQIFMALLGCYFCNDQTLRMLYQKEDFISNVKKIVEKDNSSLQSHTDIN